MAETNQTQKYTNEQKIALEKQLIKKERSFRAPAMRPRGTSGASLRSCSPFSSASL